MAHLRVLDGTAGHALLVWALPGSLGLGQVSLLGHSMGGMMVQEMSAQKLKRVARLGLKGTGPAGMLPGRIETIETSRQRLATDNPCP